MMAALARKPDAAPAPKAKSTATPGSLRIGAPDDAFEREADRVADQVMSGGRNMRDWSFSRTSIAPPLQRKCGCGGSSGPEGECEDCKQKKALQRKASSPAADHAPDTHAPAIVDDVLRSPGQPLDHATRGFFESRFGHDFSRVRIHADAKAGASARAVNSLAYTVGSDLVFAPGHYAPGTARGNSLLAHELTHVVQQSGSRSRSDRAGNRAPSLRVMRSAPSVQRQEAKREEAETKCITGRQEGAGGNLNPHQHSPAGEIVYGIWFKQNGDESLLSAVSRTIPKWVKGRFGSLSAEKSAQVKDFLTELSWKWMGKSAQSGCNYVLWLTKEGYSRARILAGEASEPKEQMPSEADAPLYNVVAGAHPGGKPSSEENKEERGAPLVPDWKVLDGNEPLARQYLRWMQQFAGMPKSQRAEQLATGGLTGEELNEIIGIDERYTYFTNLITQGYAEFTHDGGKDLDSFSPLIELVLRQFNWGNPTARRNLLRIGRGDSWVPAEKQIIGVAHRNTGLLLYDEMGEPLRSISGNVWRDPGFTGAPQKGIGINIANIKDPALFGILNMLRQNVGDPEQQAVFAAQVLKENIDQMWPRIRKGLPDEVIQKFEDALPLFVGFLAGHGVSQLLLMSANPYLIAAGGILKGLLTAAGYIMDIDFAASAIERLLLAARYLCRATRDDSGALTDLSEHYLDVAAVPLRDMVADIAMLAGMEAFGRLMGAMRGKGGDRPKIECHSCTVEPKAGEPKAGEAKADAKAKPAKDAAVGEVSKPADEVLSQAASTKETYTTILEEIQDLTSQIEQLKKEQKANPTPEGAQALKAMRAELKDLGSDAKRYENKIQKEDDQIRNSKLSLYEKIRAATPSPKAVVAVLKRAAGLDQISGQRMRNPSVDHIVPVKDIVQMKGFDKLSRESQKAIVDMPENLTSMERDANSSKGDRSWSDWTQWSDWYKDPKIKNDMVARDAALRPKLEAEIARLLALGK